MIRLDKVNDRRADVCSWLATLALDATTIARDGAVLTVVAEGDIAFDFIQFIEPSGHRTLCRTGCHRPGCTSESDHYPADLITLHLQDPPPFWQPQYRGERFDLGFHIDFGELPA